MQRLRAVTVAVAVLGAAWSMTFTPLRGAAAAGRRGGATSAGRPRGGPPRGAHAQGAAGVGRHRNGIAQHDSTSHALAVIERLGYESGAYDTYIRTDSNIAAMDPKRTTGEPASGGPNLRMADAVFFLGHRDVPIDEQQKNDLLKFVRDDGKGFVAAHTALTALESWPEFGELLGGRYDGHPWNTTTGTGRQRGAGLPGHEALPGDVRLHATSSTRRRSSRATTRGCCCALDAAKLPPNADVHVKDGDMPIVWAKTYGKGRVFYSSLGARREDLGRPRRAADVSGSHQVGAGPDRRRRDAAAAAGVEVARCRHEDTAGVVLATAAPADGCWPSACGAQEWTTHGGDLGESRFSPLTQITQGERRHARERAWEFDAGGRRTCSSRRSSSAGRCTSRPGRTSSPSSPRRASSCGASRRRAR